MHPTEGLRQGVRDLHVTPKSLSVLYFLASRPGKVVAKDALIAAVWEGVAVSDSALTSCIKELRRTLEDDARRPRFIETLNRRGYRFIAAVSPATPTRADTASTALPSSPLLSRATAATTFLGRERELGLMDEVWARAAGGSRQLILLAGEPGIGKTRLATEFASVRAESTATVLVGRCDEEALVSYQPFVEALNWYVRVCPESDLRAQLAAIGRICPHHQPSMRRASDTGCSKPSPSCWPRLRRHAP